MRPNSIPKMKGVQRHIITLLHLSLIAAMLSTSFLATRGFFNDTITSKQYGLEIICLSAGLLFVITFAFKNQFLFTKIDLLVVLFATWYLVNELFSDGNYTQMNQILFGLFLWGLVYMFIRQLSDNTPFIWGVSIIWMLVVLLQSGLGLMQLYGLENSYHGLFSITGTFHNPGPFSGFVVSGLPVALSVISYQSTVSSQKLSEKKLGVSGLGLGLMRRLGLRHGLGFGLRLGLGLKYSIQILGWITLVLILLVLPPAQSRAAWIAGLAACFYVIANHSKVRNYREKWRTRFIKIRKPIRVIILSLTITAILAGAYGLYIMKKGSADGRMLIWQITSELIKEKPLLGHGAGSFDAKYMDAQAAWFASGKGTSAQGLVAGSPEAPFNELLKLWLEKGLIAVSLVAALLYYIFAPAKKSKRKEQSELTNPGLIIAFKGSLITLLTFGLFSYPFDISSFTLQLVILLALLAGTSKPLFRISGQKRLLLSIPITFVIIPGSVYFFPQRQEYYKAMKTWQDADQLYNYRSYQASVAAYEEALNTLKSNGLFLQMYGKALSMDEEYQKSNEVLAEAKFYKSSQIIQNTLGDNHKALGNYAQAEEAYIKSAQMIPSLVFPKYLLAKLYSESGQHNKAKQIAETILNSEVKVESSATREIMNEMNKISEQLSVSSMTDD